MYTVLAAPVPERGHVISTLTLTLLTPAVFRPAVSVAVLPVPLTRQGNAASDPAMLHVYVAVVDTPSFSAAVRGSTGVVVVSVNVRCQQEYKKVDWLRFLQNSCLPTIPV